jgi:hypothetical protein
MQFAQHAGFPKLYHYENFKSEHLQTVLRDRKIHVSNMGSVNDPWDCRPWLDMDVSTSERRAEWARFFTPLMEPQSDAQREAIAKLDPPWTDNGQFLAQSIWKMVRNVWDNNVRLWRMYCLTPHPDSILMWAHYAERHTGICLEFDVYGTMFGRARKVSYRDDFPTVTPGLLADGKALTEAVLMAKSQDWRYEDEFRLLVRDRKLDPTFSLTSEDDFLALPEGTLTGLIIGARCSEANAASIQTLVDEHAPGLTVKRASCAPNRYEVAITS